jgi:Zn-dependent protease with chaperone function
MQLLIFTSAFLYFSNWAQIKTFLSKFLNPQKPYKQISNKKITELIKNKTGVTIKKFYLIKSPQLFGGMFSIFGKPTLMLSEKLYNDFNSDELEYVLLHETGHHIYNHSLQDIIVQTGLLLLGIYLVKTYELNVLYSGALGLIFVLLFVQFARWHERQAENFATFRMDSPNGMISAAKKLRSQHPKGVFFELRRKYLGWNVLPEERIKIAQKEMKRRIK